MAKKNEPITIEEIFHQITIQDTTDQLLIKKFIDSLLEEKKKNAQNEVELISNGNK